MRARRVATLVVAVLAIAAPAHADDGAGAYVDGDGDPGAYANDDGSFVGRGGRASAGDDDGCEWRVFISDDSEVPVFDASGERLFSETGRWFFEYCAGDDLLPFVGGLPLVPEGGPVDPLSLALEARDTVPIGHPAIHTSPDGDGRLYTQVPTWFWVDDTWWQPYTVTVTAGRVTTTLTATPTRAHWDAGDGERVTCEGPGVTWRTGMSDDETYCKHTYRHSSAGRSTGTYPLTVTIEFSIGWTSNVGQTGSLAGVTRTATREVEVGEIQAVES